MTLIKKEALFVSYLKILIDNWSGGGLKPRLPAQETGVYPPEANRAAV